MSYLLVSSNQRSAHPQQSIWLKNTRSFDRETVQVRLLDCVCVSLIDIPILLVVRGNQVVMAYHCTSTRELDSFVRGYGQDPLLR